MFERFVSERTGTQRNGLRYTVSLSVVAHVVAGVALVTWSFWKIDKLLPRYVPVSFAATPALPMPPPEPPPPPPPGDHHPTKHPTTTGPVTPRPPHDPGPTIPSLGPDDGNPPSGPTDGIPGGTGDGPGVGPPAPQPELPPPPPAPPRMSDAERRELIHGYLVQTVQPRVLHHFTYPSDAQRNGVEGFVIVRLKIDSHGRLLGTEVVTCREPVLCQAALQSASEAAPFPAPPALLGDDVSVDVRFEYHLD